MRSVRIPNPPNRYLADPFVMKYKNAHYCFVEDYCDKVQRENFSLPDQ